MRLAFLVLALINVVLLVWALGVVQLPEPGREPERLQGQIDADRLRLLPPDAAPAVPPVPTLPVACQRIEPLAAADVEKVRAALAGLDGWKLEAFPLKDIAGFWVGLPELASRALAEKKKGELRQMNINEGEIVEDAPGSFGIRLGEFAGKAAAEDFLGKLTRRGVRSARVVARDRPGEKQALELRAPENALAQRMGDLLSGLPAASAGECQSP